MDLIPKRTLLVDGDPLTYKFGIAEDPEVGYRNLKRYLAQVVHATWADEVKIFLTRPDCLKGYRYHVARILPYQGNRTGKSPNLPSRRALYRRLLEDGAITHPVYEADDLIVNESRPVTTTILSPDKDLHQAPGPVHLSEYKQPFPGYHALFQILAGDKADNIPPLIPRYGKARAEKFLKGFQDAHQAREGILKLVEGNTLRLAEISALVLLGGSELPHERVRMFWGDMLPDAALEELARRLDE